MQKPSKYTEHDFYLIIQGYKKLDHGGELSKLLREISRCSQCHIEHPDRSDHPENLLVRPLPLSRLNSLTAVGKYFIRVKRDNGYLRNLLEEKATLPDFLARVGSARFSIGLLPWLDYCMLHRKTDATEIMVIGIDFKNLPNYIENEKDHNLPLSSPRAHNNVWGPTWQRFWKNLFAAPYDDSTVSEFLSDRGVYFTNSILCFGGAVNPRSHSYHYIECCRPSIEQQIAIVRPQCLVSFGDLGCRNVAAMEMIKIHNYDSKYPSVLSLLGTIKDIYDASEICIDTANAIRKEVNLTKIKETLDSTDRFSKFDELINKEKTDKLKDSLNSAIGQAYNEIIDKILPINKN